MLFIFLTCCNIFGIITWFLFLAIVLYVPIRLLCVTMKLYMQIYEEDLFLANNNFEERVCMELEVRGTQNSVNFV